MNTDKKPKEENSDSRILKGLNDRQKLAVEAPLGPVLVLAGAGSGKTKVLTHRITYLIANHTFKPENILALTFTNKAAKEMRTRIDAMLNPGRAPFAQSWQSKVSLIVPGMPLLGTFHSVCSKILRQEIQHLGYSSNYVIFDDEDQQKVIRDITSKMELSTKFSPSFFRNYISQAKNVLQSPDELNLSLDNYILNIVREVYARYQNSLFSQNAVDFDDLLMLTVKIFQKFPEILLKYQQLFKYILVDEYQDTNQAQYVLLYLLTIGTSMNVGNRNLFVVGDDAQSIYGFRGSDLRNILDFERHFPDSTVIKLEQNYRSTQNILDAAQGVIGMNENQKEKTLWTENGKGEKIILTEVADEIDEAKFVAKTIINAVKISSKTAAGDYSYEESSDSFYEEEKVEEPQGHSILDYFLKKQKTSGSAQAVRILGLPQLPTEHKDLNGFAVLYRTHAQSRAVEEVFLQSKIPYQIFGGVKFYQRKEIKDVLAYLRLIVNYRDLVSLTRVLNEPARGIGEKSLQAVRDFVFSNNLSLTDFKIAIKGIKLLPKQYAAVQNFFLLIEELALFEPSENILSLMRLLLKKSGYEAWVKDGTEQGENRWENIEELFNVAERYKPMPWQEGLQEFLEEVALMTDIDNADETKEAVTMMSLHQAKGLEFDVVFLLGLEEGILPHSRSLLAPEELAEEVRLAYVGITRAKKKLYLLYANGRRVFGTFQHFPPSRILRYLPEDVLNHISTVDDL